MYCNHCGTGNALGAKFCRNCGQVLIMVPGAGPPAAVRAGHGVTGAYAPVPPPAQPSAGTATDANANTILFWFNKARPYAWIFWSAVLLIYVVRTKNFMVLVIGLAITWLVRTYCNQIDKALSPVWPVRNMIPAKTRKILGWVVPVGLSLYISLVPSLWPMLGWLPVVGPTASMTIITALIGAFTAYVLVREPSHMGAR